MPGKDEDLLARLNALKRSTVTLSTAPAIDVEVSKPLTTDDKLSERLKRLRAGENVVSTREDRPTAAPAKPDAVFHVKDDTPLHEWQHDGNEQSIEELLAELDSNDQAKLNPDDPKDIQRLMREAKAALPQDDEGQVEAEPAKNDEEANEPDEDTQEVDDEKAADEYIQRVLAELDVEQRHGIEAPEEEHEATYVDLPTTPSAMPVVSPPSYEDSELEARFSKLARGLPSTPTSKPVGKKEQKTPSKSKSKPPAFSNEEIDSWCCICNEDGQLRCLGCDGDIYCQPCWNEGHGRGPGQEQGHKAVLYNAGR